MSTVSQSGTEQTLVIRPGRAGPPRLDKYQRLLNRFYEPLFLLSALGQTRGNHTPYPQDANEVQACRRRFLRNLAYICNADKGGNTCTALGLEDTDDGYKLWVASNNTNNGVLSFLGEVLDCLNGLADAPKENRERDGAALLSKCIRFASCRCQNEISFLRRAIRECQTILGTKIKHKDEEFATWLQSFIPDSHPDHVAVCRIAYMASKSQYMARLKTRAEKEEQRRGVQEKRSSFRGVIHYIGRLAYRIRAYNQLIEDARELQNILGTCQVHLIERMPSVQRPVPDNLTTLKGIVNRMMRRDDQEKPEVERSLIERDRLSGLFKAILDKYEKCRPQVHAEIQVLEHFHRNRLTFVENDRYVACSKPACLCCALYFRHHPARMVEPESHQKVWINWGPPLVDEYKKGDAASDIQLAVMNEIIDYIRKDAISQIMRSSAGAVWHPDSLTGLTESSPAHHLNPLAYDDGFISSSTDYTHSEAEMMEERRDTPSNASAMIGLSNNHHVDDTSAVPTKNTAPEKATEDSEDSDTDDGGVSLSM